MYRLNYFNPGAQYKKDVKNIFTGPAYKCNLCPFNAVSVPGKKDDAITTSLDLGCFL